MQSKKKSQQPTSKETPQPQLTKQKSKRLNLEEDEPEKVQTKGDKSLNDNKKQPLKTAQIEAKQTKQPSKSDQQRSEVEDKIVKRKKLSQNQDQIIVPAKNSLKSELTENDKIRLTKKLKIHVDQLNKLNNTEVDQLQCRNCCQRNTAPYNNIDFDDPLLQKAFIYYVCHKCLKACHYGCMLNPVIEADLDYIVLFQQNAQHESKHKPQTIWLYICQDCDPKLSQEQECSSCLRKVKRSQGVDCLIKETQKICKIHLSCAIQHKTIFQITGIHPYKFKVSQQDLRMAKQGAVIYKSGNDCSQKQCNLCHNRSGLMVPCNEFYQQDKVGCQKVAHPSCIQKFSLKIENEPNRWDLSIQQVTNRESGFCAVQLNNLCSNHTKRKTNCYGCQRDPDLGEGNLTKMNWIQCDFCNLWYHDVCVKKSIFKKTNPKKSLDQQWQQIKLDEKAAFKCELCQHFATFLYDWAPILQSNRIDEFKHQNFQKMIEPLMFQVQGQPMFLQQQFYVKFWLIVSNNLKDKLTTQTLLYDVITSGKQQLFNLNNQIESLIDEKKNQAQEIDQKISQLNAFELLRTSAEVYQSDGTRLEENIFKIRNQYNQLEAHFSNISKGHLISASEQLYQDFQRKRLACQIANAPAKISPVLLQRFLTELESLECQDLETYQYLSTLLSDFDQVKSKIEQLYYTPQKSFDKLLSEVNAQKQSCTDDHELLNKRLETFKSIYSKMPQASVILEALNQHQPELQIIDDSDFRAQVNHQIKQIETQIQQPQIPQENPFQAVIELFCKLACGPFILDMEPLLKKYEASVEWETKAKRYKGKNSEWKLKAEQLIDSQKIDPNTEINALGPCPEGIWFDQNLSKVCLLKQKYTEYLKSYCQEVLESSELQIDQLQTYVDDCKVLGKSLEEEISKVSQKAQLMTKIINVKNLQQEANYLDQIQQLMTEVYQAKLQQINIPTDMEAMLEGKVQIIEELRLEFTSILKRCADSFKPQHIQDLKKIIQKAQKEHQLHMEKEKKIVDCLPNSEKWFMETFAKLKTLCGSQLHQIDFKDYSQLHSVIGSQKDCDALLRLPQNIKPENLVAAASNLYRSLQGAKWVFEVKSLMQGGQDTYQKELSHLLMLYYKAKELQINIQTPEEYILTDDEPNPQQELICEFEQLAQNAVEFDTLFGTHQKVIQTLEKYEKEGQLTDLVNIVDRIHQKLTSIKENSKCYISTTQELETLQKVRQYIQLNEDYQNFILSGQLSDDVNKAKTDEELFLNQKKISYEKALKLQRQAKESQIPEDIPVLRRLNDSVMKFEKFRREFSDYTKFRMRVREGSYSFASSDDNKDTVFTLKFVKRLLDDAQHLDISIEQENFDDKKLIQDLELYSVFKQKTEQLLAQLESEFRRKPQLSIEADNELLCQFQQTKQDLNNAPVYSNDLFPRMQAFDWVYETCYLLEGKYEVDESQLLNYHFWKQHLDRHTQFVEHLPLLEKHPLLQKLIWEIEQCTRISDFVKSCKNTIRHLAGKFVQMERNKGVDNYMAFKNKFSYDKLEKMIDMASRCKVDITSEIQDLNQWNSQYQRYQSMSNDGQLWEQGYEKVNTIKRNIFQSPIEQQKLYFEIEKRLQIAEDIRSDIKLVVEQANKNERRILYSRVRASLRHFQKNCKIQGIPEVEKLQKQIEQSQDAIAKCEQLMNDPDKNLIEVREILQQRVIIDMEEEELPVRREVFEYTAKQIKQIPYQSFRQLEKDYLRLKHALTKVNFPFQNEKFEKLRKNCEKCLYFIKEKGFLRDDLCEDTQEIDFEQVIADKQAQLKVQERIRKTKVEGKTQLAEDYNMSQSSSDSSLSVSSVSSSSETLSKRSIDSSSSENEDVEMAQENAEDEQNEMNEQGEDEVSEDALALRRTRREIKPNLMDDHIYFNRKKNPTTTPAALSRSQLKQKREAKQAAKEFAKQKRKQERLTQKPSDKLEYQKLSIVPDAELADTLQQKKEKLREQCRSQIQYALKQNSCLGNYQEKDVQDKVKELAKELEEINFSKNPQMDQYYRFKQQEILRNLNTLKGNQHVASLWFVAKSIQIQKLVLNSSSFSDMFDKLVSQREREEKQRKIEQRRQLLQQQQAKLQSKSHLPKSIIPGVKPNVFMQNLAPRPVLPPQVKTIDVEMEKAARKNSADSIESLQSNPAQFSDDEEKAYDPMQSMKPQIGGAAFLYPPPGMNLPAYLYNPAQILTQTMQHKNGQKEQILYDPVAHGGNQLVQPQQMRVTLAKPGSLLKVYDGALQISEDHNINVTLFSFQDVRLFQKLPQPQAKLTLKGRSAQNVVLEHFLRIANDSQSGQLLKGYCSRSSYLNGEQSDKYQSLFEKLEKQQEAAVLNLYDSVTIYFIPISSKTQDFMSKMGIQVDKQADKQNLDRETCSMAWLSQVRTPPPLRSNQIWNPQVIRALVAEQPKEQAVKYSSPITSEEPSYESVSKQKGVQKKVEINLIQAATPTAQKQEIKTDPEPDTSDEQYIDQLIARFRSGQETEADIMNKLEPIIHKLSAGKIQNAKLEQFLKENIEKNRQLQQIKSEQREMPTYSQPRYPPQPSHNMHQAPHYMPPMHGQMPPMPPFMPGMMGVPPPNIRPPPGMNQPPFAGQQGMMVGQNMQNMQPMMNFPGQPQMFRPGMPPQPMNQQQYGNMQQAPNQQMNQNQSYLPPGLRKPPSGPQGGQY